MDLNTEQTKAVAHFKGACVVTAVPGSGKTAILTSRIISLVKERNISPRNILCLTFTNKAADEMKTRILKVMPEAKSDLWVSTFHRLCLAILRKHGSRLGLSSNFTIYDSKDQVDLITKIARMHQYECSKVVAQSLAKAANDFRENASDLETVKKELNAIEYDIVKEYLTTLDKSQVIDFSGMLYKTWKCLVENPDVVAVLAKRFQYVSVDEMQDTNTVQYEIIRMISELNGNLFVVGDLNQSVYSWRGAKPENLQRLHEDFGDVTEIVLPRNYRSTKHILAAAQKLIRHNDNAKKVVLQSDRGDGVHPTYIAFKHPEEEAESIVHSIQKLRDINGYKWSDFAILYRMNSFSRSPEMVLRAAEVPYKVVGGFSFFDRAEIKTTLSYLSLLSNPNDSVAFSRAINIPKRSLGAMAVGRMERMCQEDGISILEACKRIDKIDKISTKAKASAKKFAETVERYRKHHEEGMPLDEVCTKFIKAIGYYDFVKEQSKADADDVVRFDNVEELLSSIGDFSKGKDDCKISDYLQSIQLILTDSQDTESDDIVRLMTMHSAKGKEWKCVYIIGAESGCIPHYRSVAEGTMSEERRLMYVAMTRSRDVLKISYCHVRRGRVAGASPFLDEIGVNEKW